MRGWIYLGFAALAAVTLIVLVGLVPPGQDARLWVLVGVAGAAVILVHWLREEDAKDLREDFARQRAERGCRCFDD